MGRNPRLATWLVARRQEIEGVLGGRLGSQAPPPGSPEAETLRRFRSFASSALLRGEASAPALDGLRVEPERATQLLGAWARAAAEVAGPDSPAVLRALDPLLRHFSAALRETAPLRRASGAPRASSRRAVSAALDRIADAFLAIDTDTGRIADANPVAGALLGVPRDALLEAEATKFIPESAQALWWTHLDAMAEGAEPRRFRSRLQDASGSPLDVEASLTRFATRRRTLALVLARPLRDSAGFE